MNPPLLIGAVCLVVAVWHESTWLKRKGWSRVSGKVVAFEEVRKKGKVTFLPVISYQASGEELRFTSRYGSSMKPEVPGGASVIVSPDGKSVEQYSFSNRWMLTLIPLGMGVLLVVKGLSMV